MGDVPQSDYLLQRHRSALPRQSFVAALNDAWALDADDPCGLTQLKVGLARKFIICVSQGHRKHRLVGPTFL